MDTPSPVSWRGLNGRSYNFTVYSLDHRFPDNLVGNYIITKTVPNQYLAVYIGEGIISERLNNHLREGCIASKQATHIHVMPNGNELNRKNIESELLLVHTEAYAPNGCNIKKGG